MCAAWSPRSCSAAEKARTSVAGVLLGPPDELANLLHRVCTSAGGTIAASGGAKLERMLHMEASRLRGVAAEALDSHRVAKLDAAMVMLKPAAARFHRVDGGSAAAAGAAHATARLLDTAVCSCQGVA